MSRLTLLQQNAQSIRSIATQYGASNVRVFGSTAQQRDQESSDVDLLVDWNKAHSLYDHIGLQQDLEDLLHAKVDLVVAKNVHWYVRDRVLQEAVRL